MAAVFFAAVFFAGSLAIQGGYTLNLINSLALRKSNKFSVFGVMRTLFIGKNVIFLPEVESTNSYAVDLLKNVNLPEGTVVHATRQTGGRGQRGSTWIADPARNLTASLVLRPGFLEFKNQFYLYKILALACYDTMAELLNSSQIDIKIKWPNDILVNRKKIAGILIENNILNNRINWSVAGVGINVNQQQFPAEVTATSLLLSTGREFTVAGVLEQLCEHLEKYYLMLRNGHLEQIRSVYLSRILGMGHWMRFEHLGAVNDYLLEGVSDSGLLRLRHRSGAVSDVDVKEVKWIL